MRRVVSFSFLLHRIETIKLKESEWRKEGIKKHGPVLNFNGIDSIRRRFQSAIRSKFIQAFRLKYPFKMQTQSRSDLLRKKKKENERKRKRKKDIRKKPNWWCSDPAKMVLLHWNVENNIGRQAFVWFTNRTILRFTFKQIINRNFIIDNKLCIRIE